MTVNGSSPQCGQGGIFVFDANLFFRRYIVFCPKWRILVFVWPDLEFVILRVGVTVGFYLELVSILPLPFAAWIMFLLAVTYIFVSLE